MHLNKISRRVVGKIFKTHSRFKNDSSDNKDGQNEGPTSDGKNMGEVLGSACNTDNPCEPNMYDCRKYGHNLPCDNVTPPFETIPYMPSGIFRCTYNEVLGRGANKGCYYQNPEYFSFQHMTYYDMHMLLRPYRLPVPKTGRKP